ncbi:MAG TPA: hypothetical protein VFC63_24240 [Blastocatellia bacterium]|nr:hypothetical protein [Blastocatellia bacterium]
MKNIEMFFILAVALFFFFIYTLLSADPTFGLNQTINLFLVFVLICALGTLLIRRVTRKRPAAANDEKKLNYLNLESDSDIEPDAVSDKFGRQETESQQPVGDPSKVIKRIDKQA